MFLKKKKFKQTYDKTTKHPILHCSICTGEQVAGFKNMQTGEFEDVMLIRNEQDLAKFKKMYGIDKPITKEY